MWRILKIIEALTMLALTILALTLVVAVFNFSVFLASCSCSLFELIFRLIPNGGSLDWCLFFSLSGLFAAAECLVCKLDDLNYSLKLFIKG